MERGSRQEQAIAELHPLEINSKKLVLHGEARVRDDARGVVLIVHASGHNRLRPLHRALASVLESSQLGAVCIDLLAAGELHGESAVVHSPDTARMLAERLATMTRWVERSALGRGDTKLAYLGMGLGVPAVCLASVVAPRRLVAAVCWDGHPDVGARALARITLPVSLLVGGLNARLLEANCDAYAALRGPRHLEVIQGVKHLVGELAFPLAAQHAQAWLARHLTSRGTAAGLARPLCN